MAHGPDDRSEWRKHDQLIAPRAGGRLAKVRLRRRPTWVDLLGGAVLVGIAAVMAAWTWRTWPDVLIDFGREVYVAWRLSQGEVLHRDVVSVSGPLSA